jgi:hypothetical protein
MPAFNGSSAEGRINQPSVLGHGIKTHPRIEGYYNSPWPGEAGGPERLQVPYNLDGRDIKQDDEVLGTRRFTQLANMMILRKQMDYTHVLTKQYGQLEKKMVNLY